MVNHPRGEKKDQQQQHLIEEKEAHDSCDRLQNPPPNTKTPQVDEKRKGYEKRGS